MTFEVGDKVIINNCKFSLHDNKVGIIQDIELFEGDWEFMIKLEQGVWLFHEGEFSKVE